MIQVKFTSNLERHLSAPACEVAASTVFEALDKVFLAHPQLRGYVLDDQGRLRQHVAVFVDGSMVRDRDRLSDLLGDNSEIFIMQALSGG